MLVGMACRREGLRGELKNHCIYYTLVSTCRKYLGAPIAGLYCLKGHSIKSTRAVLNYRSWGTWLAILWHLQYRRITCQRGFSAPALSFSHASVVYCVGNGPLAWAKCGLPSQVCIDAFGTVTWYFEQCVPDEALSPGGCLWHDNVLLWI